MYSPCLSAIGGGQPLSSPKRHSLGKPLPYQLADAVQAAQRAKNLYSYETIGNYLTFRLAMPDSSVRTCVILPRLPLSLRIVRLACLIHAASVHPELGSNSEYKRQCHI